MCRTSVTAALVFCATFAGLLRSLPALAAEPKPEPPVTPFLDSGNDLPDLEARERERRQREPRPRLGEWYGWQILAADLAMLGVAAGLDQPVFLAPYVFTGPAIHVAHGRRGLAGISIGIRLAVPLWAGVIGRSFANCPESTPTNWSGFCGLDKAATGALIGAAIATVIDAAIGFTRLPPEAPATPEATRRPAHAITPRVSLGQTGVSLGLGAVF